jgi:protease-4
MKSFYPYVRGFFAWFGITCFIAAIIGLAFLNFKAHADKNKPLPDHLTLTFTLLQPMVESVPPIVREFSGGDAPPGLEEWVVAMESAAHDPKVSAVYIRAVGGEISLTQVEELRASIARLRAAGKPVIFFTDTFGEMENGTGLYYLAAACSKIVLQPGGFVGFSGVAIEEPFARGLLDKYGVLPEFEKRESYKSAMDVLTEKNMTDADREQLTRLLGHLAGHILDRVSADRHVDKDKLIALRDASPLPADGAKVLVDAVQYEDQIQFPAERVTVDDYLAERDAPKAHGKTPRVVLINAEGEIVRGEGGGESAFADTTMGAEDFVQTLADIEKDKDIKAVIIRLNSPGGSAIASETMNRAVQHLKDSGRPVIVSMGEVAASGGYYMAAPATRILAEPSTLTGSIGVIVGKISLGGLSGRFGVHWDEIAVGNHAALFATGRGFSADERAAVAKSADVVYDTFKSRVAAGRKLSPDVVEQLAQGQVWTGAEAKENGLVDELGGLMDAIAATKKLLGLKPTEKISIEPYPDQDNPALILPLLLHKLGLLDTTHLMGMLHEKFQSLLRVRTLEMAPLKVVH